MTYQRKRGKLFNSKKKPFELQAYMNIPKMMPRSKEDEILSDEWFNSDFLKIMPSEKSDETYEGKNKSELFTSRILVVNYSFYKYGRSKEGDDVYMGTSEYKSSNSNIGVYISGRKKGTHKASEVNELYSDDYSISTGIHIYCVCTEGEFEGCKFRLSLKAVHRELFMNNVLRESLSDDFSVWGFRIDNFVETDPEEKISDHARVKPVISIVKQHVLDFDDKNMEMLDNYSSAVIDYIGDKEVPTELSNKEGSKKSEGFGNKEEDRHENDSNNAEFNEDEIMDDLPM